MAPSGPAGPYLASVGGHAPVLAEGVYVAPGAMVVGQVRIGRDTSIWYGSVLRGDDAEIVLGERCNVQDACVMHADPGYPAVLGDRVSLGHGAIIHGARIDDDVLVGMRAVVLNGAHVGRGSLIAAGAVVRPGSQIPPGSLVAGVPARVRRPVSEAERGTITRTPDSYWRKAAVHRDAVPLVVSAGGGGDSGGR